MSSSKARVDVGSPNSPLEFSLLNSDFQEVASGTGSLSAQVDPGIYQLQVRAGPQTESKLLVLQPGGEHRDLLVQLAYPSAAPLPGTSTSHEFQQLAAEDASSRLLAETGPPSGLVIVVRNPRGQDSLPFDKETVADFSLLGSNLRPVTGFARRWKIDRGECWATWSSRLEPGGYVLRSVRPSTPTGPHATVDQSLWLSPNWQTLIFVPNTQLGPDTDNASIHMTPIYQAWTPTTPWDPQSEQANAALELALWGLRERRTAVPDDLNLLLSSKFANPMLGIVGAHSLLLAPTVDFPRVELVLNNLSGLVPGHPDVAALQWLKIETQFAATPSAGMYPPVSVSWPPMLSAGYSALIRNDARTPSGIVTGSTAQSIAPNVVSQSVWTSWLPLPGTVRKPRAPARKTSRAARPRMASGGGSGGGRKSAQPSKKTVRSRTTKAAPAAATPDPATARVERYLTEVTRVSTAESPAETLTQTSRDQISVATSLPIDSVDQAIEKLSSSWTS